MSGQQSTFAGPRSEDNVARLLLREFMSTDLHSSPKKRKLIYIWSSKFFKTHPTHYRIYTSLCIYIFIYMQSTNESLLTTIYFSLTFSDTR